MMMDMQARLVICSMMAVASTAVPSPEVTIEYKAVPAGYILFCYALLIEDTPLLVDGLTMEWLDQYGSSLGKRSGTSIAVLTDGRSIWLWQLKALMTCKLNSGM